MFGQEITEPSCLFGPFQLVPWRRLLRNGGKVALTSRALGVLSVLAERHSQIVSKSEILAEVWRDITVEDHNLMVQISVLRKILGPGVIATYPGRGYKLVGPVTWLQGTAPPQAPFDSNLPKRRLALIGRQSELTELELQIVGHRLVTLTGTSGMGKTSVAIELGRQLDPLFPGGTRLIDLAPLTDPLVVASAAATALGVALGTADAPVTAIAAAIGTRRLLLIFDNCEHLVDAAAELIGALLDLAPGLSVLATSQETLRLADEQVYRLNPLALPPLADASPNSRMMLGKSSASYLKGFGAIELFVERACAADRHFKLAPTNAASVVEICRRLDGVPLALEMAAARVPLLGIEGLRAGLDERLRLLRGGRLLAESRHRTLQDMVEWSHSLLGMADQRVFRRLGILSGSFSLDAAIAVAGEATERWEIVDALGRLLDKSLVGIREGEPPRYRLIETLRLYALKKLDESGEKAAVAERHARYFMELLDRAHETRESVSDAEWLSSYRPEVDNVRSALDWAMADPGRGHVAVALAGPAALLWSMLALVAEGRRYTDRAVALIDKDMPLATVARLLKNAGRLWGASHRRRALALQEQSAALYRQIGDGLSLASVLTLIGHLHINLGQNDQAKKALSEAFEILSASGYNKSLLNVVSNLGNLASSMSEPDEARHHFGIALQLARSLRDPVQENLVLINVSVFEYGLGDIDRAIDQGQEAVRGLRAINHRSYLGWALCNLASYLIARDKFSAARAAAEEALTLVREDGGFVVRLCLQQWALLGAVCGRHSEAASLMGFVNAGYAKSGDIRQPAQRRIDDHLKALLESKLATDDIRYHGDAGALWNENEAVQFTIDRVMPADAC